MKKNVPLISLIILLFVLGYLVFENKNSLFKIKNKSENNNNQQVTSETTGKYNLPVAANTKNVSSVLIHYFFTGKLKELRKQQNGTEIIFYDADPALPDLIVTNKTRVSKITPPYESNPVIIDVGTLKSGQTIDISAEFDIRTGTWFILDVFLATDRN